MKSTSLNYIDIICQQNDVTNCQSSPTSWGRPKAVSTETEYNAERSFKIGCRSEYTTHDNLENSSGSTIVPFRRLLYQLRVQKLQLIVPGYGGPKKSRKPRQPLLTNYVWWVSGVKNTQAGSARFVEKNMIGSNQNRLLVV